MRRFMPRAVTLTLVVVAILIVALSPFALDDFGGSAASWARRANIGQTYGAAAALLAVLALGGVVASLALQARETKVNREHASRAEHTELIKMALDDPAYVECWGPYADNRNSVAARQYGYVNLILSYWQGRFELGTFTDKHLRHGAREMFSSPPGRLFWVDARDDRATTYQTRREHRFHAIVDEEYRRAVENTPHLPEPPEPLPERPKGRVAKGAAIAGGVLAAGVAAGWWTGRRRRR